MPVSTPAAGADAPPEADPVSAPGTELSDFSWLADGVTEDERRAAAGLRDVLRAGPAAAETLLGFSWLADGVTADESWAVLHLQVVVREGPAAAEALLGFSWLADGVTADERNILYALREVLLEDPAAAEALLGFWWLADGVTADERNAVYAIWQVLLVDRAAAAGLLGSVWLADGVTSDESWSLGGLGTLYGMDRGGLSALTARPWFGDGLSIEELALVGDLGNIAYRSEAHALAIIDMPFLSTFEPADALAVAALRKLAYCWGCSASGLASERVNESFRRVMDHPAISDGISDEEAKIVAGLPTVSMYNPGLLDTLLAPGSAALQERTVDLPLAGEVQFTIIRTGPGAERTMDLLERVVRSIEGFMAHPLPIKHVIYLSADIGNAANHWTALVFPPELDTPEASEVLVRHVFAHEIAHYYWRSEWAQGWMSEGGATFFQSLHRMQATAPPGEPVAPIWPPHWPPCPYVGDIAGLDRLDRGVLSESAHLSDMCYYSLGERLWQDLYRSLGESVFRRGYRNLYLMSRGGGPDSRCQEPRAGICHVEAAFKAAAPDAAAAVDTTIARWYDSSEPYDTSHIDTAPADPNLPGGVKITQSYISLDADRREETTTDSFSAGEIQHRVFLHLHFSSPLAQQKTQQLPLKIVEYFQDGFPYRSYDATHTLDPGRPQTSRWFPIGPWTGYTWVVGDFEHRTWAPGRYWIHVYYQHQKIAEAEFQVTP